MRFVYYHDLPRQLSDEAQSRTWQDQSSTPLDEPWPLAAWPDVPIRVLAGRHDRMFPLEFQRRIVRERLGLEVNPDRRRSHGCAEQSSRVS